MEKEKKIMPLLLELLPEVDRYLETESGQPSLAALAAYLQRQHSPQPQLPAMDMAELESRISRHIGELYKFARLHTRHTLEEAGLQSLEEFGIIMHTMLHPGISKTSLYKDQLVEYSTGNEIVKRLIDKGLMEQAPHPEDKRARVLYVTPQGQHCLTTMLPHMYKDAHTIAGNLTDRQKHELLQVLGQLEQYHRQLIADS